MGQKNSRQLKHAIREKLTTSGTADGITYVCTGVQGYRANMEDAHAGVTMKTSHGDVTFFGVFDGHGGAGAANYCAKHLPEKVLDAFIKAGGAKSAKSPAVEDAIVKAFIDFDDRMAKCMSDYCNPKNGDDPGTTAIVLIVTETELVFVNLGDSRAALQRGGQVAFQTKDHKPDSDNERLRIENAGGFVASGRICRCLAVSRAFGDHMFKDRTESASADEYMVSPCPDVTVITRKAKDEMCVLGCDGVFDVLSTKSALIHVSEKLLQGNLETAAEGLLDHCLGMGSTDNISATVVLFKGARRQSNVAELIDDWFDDLPDDDDGEAAAEPEEPVAKQNPSAHQQGKAQVSTHRFLGNISSEVEV